MEKISVYDRLETNFTHNGIILPDVISCIDEEELNSKYILELTHPIDEKGKWEYLVEENIVKAAGQLFRIHKTETNLDYVYVYARHIFYDLIHNFLEDVRPTNINGAGALNWILMNTQYPHNFIGMSDIDTLSTQYYIRKNPVEAMLGTDSLVTRWNGELVRDNFTVKLLSSRGTNKGAQIAYGKNILGLEVERDMDTVITRIMPIGRDGLLLPEKYIDSPFINNYAFPRIQKIEVDVGVDEETTIEQAYYIMRQACYDLYDKNKIDIPYVNINTNLLLLENTEEYKHLKNLVKVELGDIVSCTDNPLKISFEAKVIRIKRDLLSGRNVEVELGQIRKKFSNRLETVIKDISEEIANSKSDLTKAIENATNLLTNALGGYVVKRVGEILIMDTEDINTATQIWRWNLNGLGYSNTGVNGPYEVAMTMDGKINANFITTGTLSAGIVKTGVLSSNDNSTWINLDDGSFNFKNVLKYEDGQIIISPEFNKPRNLFESARYIRCTVRQMKNGDTILPTVSWTELQVFADNVNIALGKTVTTNYTGTYAIGSPLEYTDGSTDSFNGSVLFSNGGVPYYMQVDLGAIYHNIEKLVNYLITSVNYTVNNKIEVSTDGLSWLTIFDSEVDGFYQESLEGKTINRIVGGDLEDEIANIKNLTPGMLQGGITTLTNERIKVEHGSGKYSEIRADGFVRGYPSGEINYLKGVDILEYTTALNELNNAPSAVTLTLPIHYKDRTDFKAIPFVGEYQMRVAGGDDEYRYDNLSLILNVDYIITGTNPSATINSYMKRTTITTTGSITKYYPMSFKLMLIGD